MTLPEQILQALTDAFSQDRLNSRITPDVLPPLARALEAVVKRYIIKYGVFPDEKTFQAVANNFFQDGPYAGVSTTCGMS